MSNDLDVPVLVLVGGALDGTKFSVDDADPKTLGASSECDFPIRLENVAERHAQLVWNAGMLAISDLGSQSGVYVNGEKLDGERVLEQGDRVCLGPPGSKQSAKLLVELPTPTEVEAEDEGDAFTLDEGEAVSLMPVDLSLDEEAPQIHPDFAAPEPVPSPPSPPPPVPSAPAPEPVPTDEEVLVVESPPPLDHEQLIPVIDEPPQPAHVAPSPQASAPAPTGGTIPFAPEKPDYQTTPSIAPIEPPSGEPPAPAARPRPLPSPRPVSSRPVARARGRRSPLPRIPPIVLLGGGTVVVLLAVYLVLSRMMAAAPAVVSILPPKLEVGQNVTVSGEHLGGGSVQIGDKPATVVRASEDQIVATVPELGAGTFPLVVVRAGKTSNSLQVIVAPIPRIKRIDPDVALPGQVVTLEGANLTAAKPTVTVGNAPAKILAARGENIRISVPSVAAEEGQSVPVVVKVGTETSRPVQLLLGRLPLLDSVAPSRGLPGERVVLKGRGFAPTPSGNIVHFGSSTALVVSASPTELTIIAPGPYGTLSQLGLNVSVSVGGSTSVDRSFTILQASTGMYLPHFFAAAPPASHPGHQHAVVATSLGPVLLLSGKGQAPSVAERAEAVAQALNKAFASATGGGVAIESTGSPPAVTVSGSSEPLVTVTSEDAQGMGETWLGSRGGRTTPQSLARYWAALLSDYLALFAARQRPVSSVQLASDGRVFLDIYAQAARRTGGPMGVPTGMLSPLPAPWAESLRRLALMAPGAGTAARADTAVEGAWSGTMQDGDAPQHIDVRIARQGARLTGTVQIQKGAIVVKSPLTDVSFQGGILRFTMAVGATNRLCEGKLQGDTITGAVKKSSGQETGTFSLRFAD